MTDNTTPAGLPPLPANISHVTRRIRACESEEPAQLVLEYAMRAYALAAIACQGDAQTRGDERRHFVCVCPDCAKPTQPAAPLPAVPDWRMLTSDEIDEVFERPRQHNAFVYQAKDLIDAFIAKNSKPAAPPAPASREQDSSHLAACAGDRVQVPLTEPKHWEGLRRLGWVIHDCRVCGESAGCMESPPLPLAEGKCVELWLKVSGGDYDAWGSVLEYSRRLEAAHGIVEPARGNDEATGQIKSTPGISASGGKE